MFGLFAKNDENAYVARTLGNSVDLTSHKQVRCPKFDRVHNIFYNVLLLGKRNISFRFLCQQPVNDISCIATLDVKTAQIRVFSAHALLLYINVHVLFIL